MTKRDLLYYEIAKSVSKTSDYHRIKIGAVIVHRRDIIAVAANEPKSHPKQYELNKLQYMDKNFDHCQHYLHAEMKCILRCKDTDLSRARIYIYREDMQGNLAICRPCIACMTMIRNVGIREIFYTTKDGYVHESLK